MKRHGFSLIEVSIAMFILAMLVAVSVPAFVRSFNDMSLREAARTFATTCQYARIEAVQRQANATLHVDLDRQMFWLTQVGEDAGTLKSYELSKRVTVVSAERVGEPGKGERSIAVLFFPNGTCESATVVFRGGEKTGLAATIDPITCKATVYPVKL